MTVEQFLETYGGNVCVSIIGYCKKLDIDDISNDLELLNEVKDLEVSFWNIMLYENGDTELRIEVKKIK